jgi:general secretion pathway protein K
MALVLVLWVITLLSVVAASFSLGVRRDAGVAHSLTQASIAQAAAEAGIRIAMLGLEHPNPEGRWEAGDPTRYLAWNGIELQITISAETGRVDINHADALLLDGLLTAVGVEDPNDRAATVAQIQDWRDPSPDRHLNGLSAADYRRLGHAYGPANAPFQATEELLLLPAIGAALYRRLEPLVTVHSRQSGVNPIYADYPVLLALPGVDAGLAASWLEQRDQARAQGLPVPALGVGDVAGGAGAMHTVRSIATLPSGASAGVSVVMQKGSSVTPNHFAWFTSGRAARLNR